MHRGYESISHFRRIMLTQLVIPWSMRTLLERWRCMDSIYLLFCLALGKINRFVRNQFYLAVNVERQRFAKAIIL